MAGELITIEKGKRRALCERFQLAAIEAKGWRVAPPPKVDARGEPLDIEPAPGLFEVAKGDKKGWCDEEIFKGLKEQGWKREGQGSEEGDQEEADAPGGDEGQEALELILSALDPDDDALWKDDDALKMGAFNDQFDRRETRATIEAAWPGFNRDSLAAVGEGDE